MFGGIPHVDSDWHLPCGLSRLYVMRARHITLAIVAAFLACAPVLSVAHHTLSGIYERSQQTTMRGVVIEFRFVNPHPILVIEVQAADGEAESWQLEMDNRFELARIGVTEETFKPGDQVFVKGSIGVVRPRTFYLWRLDRPVDGFWYEQRGSTPFAGFRD
jgi:hypothetical protein